jgi:hypothetical protein
MPLRLDSLTQMLVIADVWRQRDSGVFFGSSGEFVGNRRAQGGGGIFWARHDQVRRVIYSRIQSTVTCLLS